MTRSESVGMTKDGTTMKLPTILRLPWPNKGSMHPDALQTYLTFLQEVLEAVPSLYLLSEDELKAFLPDKEYARLEACGDEIREWLKKCSMDNDRASLAVYPYHSPFGAMRDLKELLQEVHERRVLREKRKAALDQITPPFEDAKKYLGEKEYERFLESLPGAADAYLQTSEKAKSYEPKIWLLNANASDYSYWTLVMKERKEKEARCERADIKHTEFMEEVNNTIKRFKQELAKETKPSFVYSPVIAKYKPGEWYELELPTTNEVKKWATPHIWERVPEVLKGFLSWELDCDVQTLPHVKYQNLGVHCLTWCFRVLVLVKVDLGLVEKEFTKEFHGYEYPMKLKPEGLGCFYLGPVEWDDQEGFTTPIALLSMLAKGALEDDGIEIMDRDGSSISFRIRGYDDAFAEIDDRFRQFIMDVTKQKTLAQGLRDAGVIDGLTAQVLEEKAKLPLPQPASAGVSAGEGQGDNSDVVAAIEGMGYKKAESKKAIEAAHLFPGMSFEDKVKAVLKILGA